MIAVAIVGAFLTGALITLFVVGEVTLRQQTRKAAARKAETAREAEAARKAANRVSLASLLDTSDWDDEERQAGYEDLCAKLAQRRY